MGFPVEAALGLAGSVAGGLFSASGQRDANRTNMKIAADNRKFQERMSSTAHQRETHDLEKAGLNRILGFTGKGASTPPGAMTAVGNVGGAGVEGAAKGMAAAHSAAQLALTKAQTRKISFEAELGETKADWFTKIKDFFSASWNQAQTARDSKNSAKTYPLPEGGSIAPPTPIESTGNARYLQKNAVGYEQNNNLTAEQKAILAEIGRNPGASKEDLRKAAAKARKN